MKALFASILVILSLVFTLQVKAQDCNGSIDEKIKCYSDNVTKLQASGKTLSSQIAQFDAQSKLTTLTVNQTEEKIALLAGRIDQLSGSVDALTKSFSQRAVETYKMARTSDSLTLILTSPNLSEVFGKFTYLKKIQDADRDLMERLNKAKDNYSQEKLDQEELQSQLETQQKQLNTQKTAKKGIIGRKF